MCEWDDGARYFDSLNASYAGYRQHVTLFQAMLFDQTKWFRVREADMTDRESAAVRNGFCTGGNDMNLRSWGQVRQGGGLRFAGWRMVSRRHCVKGLRWWCLGWRGGDRANGGPEVR